jgi:hypothetical protein
MLSENILYDPSYNSLSIEAQALFVRMLIKTDDYGVLPGDQFSMLNLPRHTERQLESLLAEIEDAGLIKGFLYEEKPFFAFKRDRFDDYQSYLIAKRTKSEYLRLDRESMEGKVFQDILGHSWKFQKVTPLTHRKYRVESTEHKDKNNRREFASYDEGTKQLIVPESVKEALVAEYGRPLYESEVPAMERWLKVNKPKRDYNRFMWNWLNRSASKINPNRKPLTKTCPIHKLDYEGMWCPRCYIK